MRNKKWVLNVVILFLSAAILGCADKPKAGVAKNDRRHYLALNQGVKTNVVNQHLLGKGGFVDALLAAPLAAHGNVEQ